MTDTLASTHDTYPAWTIRYTWGVLDADDQVTQTYDVGKNESDALDRAAFMLDHYNNDGASVLIRAEVKRPGGWQDVLRSQASVSLGGGLHGWQRSPQRPG
jgi:hypothetical protein